MAQSINQLMNSININPRNLNQALITIKILLFQGFNCKFKSSKSWRYNIESLYFYAVIHLQPGKKKSHYCALTLL